MIPQNPYIPVKLRQIQRHLREYAENAGRPPYAEKALRCHESLRTLAPQVLGEVPTTSDTGAHVARLADNASSLPLPLRVLLADVLVLFAGAQLSHFAVLGRPPAPEKDNVKLKVTLDLLGELRQALVRIAPRGGD